MILSELTPETFLDEIEDIAKRCYVLRDRALAELPATQETAVCMGAFGSMLAILEMLVSLGPPRPRAGEEELFARFDGAEEYFVGFCSLDDIEPEESATVTHVTDRDVLVRRIAMPNEDFLVESLRVRDLDGNETVPSSSPVLVPARNTILLTVCNQSTRPQRFTASGIGLAVKTEEEKTS